MNFPKKLLPYFLLAVSTFMLWDTWLVEHTVKEAPRSTVGQAAESRTASNTIVKAIIFPMCQRRHVWPHMKYLRPRIRGTCSCQNQCDDVSD